MRKIGIYIDTNNLYQSLKHAGLNQLNYSELMRHVRDMGQIVDAVAYGNEFANEANEFKCMLNKSGITPKYKQISRSHKPSNWNTSITIDIVRRLPELDMVVICSGDGDLTPVATYVRDHEKKLLVIACTPSRSLSAQADTTIEIFEGLLI